MHLLANADTLDLFTFCSLFFLRRCVKVMKHLRCDNPGEFLMRAVGETHLFCEEGSEEGTDGCACTKSDPSSCMSASRGDPSVVCAPVRADPLLQNVSSAPWGPQNIIPSSVPADILATTSLYSGPENKICWASLEALAAPVSAVLATDVATPFGFLVEQLYLWRMYNEGYGTLCETAIHELAEKITHLNTFFSKEQSLTEDVNACEHDFLMSYFEQYGFAKSPRLCFNSETLRDACVPAIGEFYPLCTEPRPDPIPPQPKTGPCSLPPDVCPSGKASYDQAIFEHNGNRYWADVCKCQQCDEASSGPCLTQELRRGLCDRGTCSALDPDVPLCSDLKGIVSAPRGCEDAPHYDAEGGDRRRACATRVGRDALWQCHLPPEQRSCPTSVPSVMCYWDGPFAGV